MQQQEQEIIERFREIKRKQYIAIIPMIAVIFILIFSAENPNFTFLGLSNQILIIIGAVGVIFSLIFSLVNWRCPNCNSYLGKEFSPRFCRSCGARLQE